MAERIDRQRLVSRHNPVVRGVEPLAPLAVGNGEFVYTVDVTGTQSFPEDYQAPLSTQAQWGWEVSDPGALFRLSPLTSTVYATDPRRVGYPVQPEASPSAYHWKRQNPHRLQLGQIGMTMDGAMARGPWRAAALKESVQSLDLWTGLVESRFAFAGDFTTVTTGCHPSRDQVGIRIVGRLVRRQGFAMMIRFPSTDCADVDWRHDIDLNWNPDPDHGIAYTMVPDGVEFCRTMNRENYGLRVRARLKSVRQVGPNTFYLDPDGSDKTLEWEIAFGFFPTTARCGLESVARIHEQSREHWQAFWQNGGAVDFSQSRDLRALELERRVVLSQYLTAIHCRGSLPPQETGLAYNSWFGKFHLEMTWWHAAHFFLWNRSHLADGVMAWYRHTLGQAKALAQSQGYQGARWPKTVGPDGEQTPSPIAPLLLWQQPHPIALAELCYHAVPTRSTLEAYYAVVFETAQFMADRLVWDSIQSRYILPAPLIPVQETHSPEAVVNPAFELEYWHYGLGLAIAWLARMGMKAPPAWSYIRENLASIPQGDGVYLAHENCPDTYTQHHRDHPSMLGALGMLPGCRIDRTIMRRTFQKVQETWSRQDLWGWDFAMMAMTATRLGEPQWAVDVLMMDTVKNRYLINGHNYQDESLLAYLPGNGGLLSAVAMMAAGWRTAPAGVNTPGFPQDGTWTVAAEDLRAWL